MREELPDWNLRTSVRSLLDVGKLAVAEVVIALSGGHGNEEPWADNGGNDEQA